ncbi:hypothetical protein KIPB_002727, partial [Kipferlia bialata]|eukprot:g2727.t1
MSRRDNLPWVEKYRPKKIDDVSHQNGVTDSLRQTIATGDLPHLLFYGPPGVGKTTTIRALCHELFGPKLFKSKVKELNASDDRGIDVVRTRIKNFARVVANQKDPKYPSPPFKVIILDEADSMTRDAQAALRRTMETYARTTRFCIICNYVSRIIDPIASRCVKCRFQPIPDSAMMDTLTHIVQQEKVQIGQEGLQAIISESQSDMRRAVTLLQTVHTVYGSGITPTCISEACGAVPQAVAQGLVSRLRSGQGSVTTLCTQLAEDVR